jgi:hypothetical protein
MKLNVPTGPYEWCADPSREPCQIPWTSSWLTTYLAHIFAKLKTAWTLTRQDVLVTRTQVQTLYQQQTPHLQSYTQTHLDLWHSTLGYDLKFQHKNFRAFSIQSLVANSECPLVRAKFCHPQGPSNTNSKRRTQPIQLPLQCSHQCTPQWTYRLTHWATNPQAPVSILAPRPAYQILATCNNCNSCL